MEILKMNINVGGGLINHIAIKDDKVYRFVEDGLMIYKYNQEDIDTLIDKILEQEYGDNFIATLEYDINTFNKINEENILSMIERYDIRN
ncbi:TPA: hypothetical protein ACKONR_000631 [Clostridioides difficile]|uniref:hypothetical protein n=1 Tax=Clostridioides difficile TaxID=1496 RepID=UPI000825A7F1|nr:hypothetical protein [Clostridioides difficile]AXU29706.1 hypothetical protein CDIF102859_04080 [Clostridioides difficile]AXU33494.1 hypothetical protein CDIF102860_04095 [Clostridioides difficile]AXU37280.1 hypothetical protein CDIF102978_04095 [Clostridioides difficile]MBY1133337.1 hypothetical protein [Clostridioides difficile]MBY1883473.1 hypothetical protein [Clostridioides difficile]